jgi:hypothetical protein
VEVLIAVAIMGMLFAAMYAGVKTNIALVQSCREEETATQILTEKFETIRLYNWDQINSNGFIPTTFTLPIDPSSTNSAAYYTGTVRIAPAPYSETYASKLKLVTVSVNWVSNRRLHTRSMTSLIHQYGLQTYVEQ